MNDEMKPIVFRRPGITEHLVARLREYARYIDENAENIVGTVEGRRMLDEHGLHISFEVSRTGYKLHVDHDWIVDGEEFWMEGLKPCPFCGGEAQLTIREFGGECFQTWCLVCGARTGTGPTEAEAVAAWNTRYRDCDKCHLDAVPAAEENMAKYGWVKERTCHIIEDGYMDDPAVCSYCGTHYDGGRYCRYCGARVVD